MKYKILVIRALWVIILLLMDLLKRGECDDLEGLSIVIAKRYQADLMRYAEINDD